MKISYMNIKIAECVLFILSIAAFLMPVVHFDELHISLFDIVGMSSDITDLMDKFGMSSELIRDEINSYFVVCIFLIILPVIESILLLIINGKLAFVVSIAGSMINTVMAYIFYDKIGNTVSLINDAVSFLGMEMKIKMATGTAAFWIICTVLILGLSVFGLVRGEFRKSPYKNFQSMREILPEEIPPTPESPAHSIHSKPRIHPASPKPEYMETSCQEKSPAQAARKFYGGLIGKNNIFDGKVRLFDLQEQVVVGTNQYSCDILLNAELDGKEYCSISFDAALGEYRVTPCCKNGVFLQSGQPLGKDRIYCLPRGMVLIIQDEQHKFRLA